MKNNNRFANELFRIIEGALRLDVNKVRSYTGFLADNLEKEGEKVLAGRLRKLIEKSERKLRPSSVEFSSALPVDGESRFPLVEHVACPEESPLVLSGEQWEVVREFTDIAKNYARVDDGTSSLSLLVYGPPGTGKSRLARHLSRELGLEMYVARLDGLVSSYLGSTAKNIRAVFEFAAGRPCMLFLDEFDAIAKLRGDSQELGELKRVVNSFMQNLDTVGRESIVVAATNHEELLDAAVWRRFSYRLPLGLPDEGMRLRMWADFSAPIEFTKRELTLLVDLSEDFSGSDIREVCGRLNRQRLISGEIPGFEKVFSIMRNMSVGEGRGNQVTSLVRGLGSEETVGVLRTRNPRLYSLSSLAHLLGVSKATAHRLALKRASRRNNQSAKPKNRRVN